MQDNRLRLLSDVVSLDAWHSPFQPYKNSIELRVEITFKEGRIGGDDADFPFTFKLSLKKATLIVSLEEPLAIDRGSIARNIPGAQIEYTKIRSVKDRLTASLNAEGSISLAKFSAAFSTETRNNKEIEDEQRLKIVETVPPILVSSEPRSSNQYAWTLEPSYLPNLIGQPWDPIAAPRLLARYPPGKIGKIPPGIRAEITCATEDLRIYDIVPKKDRLFPTTWNTRMAAAQQHLRHVLHEMNLEPGKMDNRFSMLMLASALAASE